MLKHFEHTVKDYSDHIAEIDNKLVAIMEGMLDAALAKVSVQQTSGHHGGHARCCVS